MAIDRQERIKHLKKVKEELQKKEDLLFFFEKEKEYIKELEQKQDSQESTQKVSNEEYVSPRLR